MSNLDEAGVPEVKSNPSGDTTWRQRHAGALIIGGFIFLFVLLLVYEKLQR